MDTFYVENQASVIACPDPIVRVCLDRVIARLGAPGASGMAVPNVVAGLLVEYQEHFYYHYARICRPGGWALSGEDLTLRRVSPEASDTLKNLLHSNPEAAHFLFSL